MKKTLLLTTFVLILLAGKAQTWQEIDKVLPTQYLTAAGEEYGKSVSVEGEYAVVGAPGNTSEKGHAYVLFHNGSNWETKGMLTASDGEHGDLFGFSVDIFGDYIVVGAYGDKNDGFVSGSAYIFEKPVTGWTNMTQTAKISASDGESNDMFGYSISIFGDCVVAGAYQDDDNGINSGSAYIFEKPVSGWINMTQTAKLTASGGGSSDHFGISVSIFNESILIGTYERNSSEGSAYVFEKPISGWTNMTQTATLKASDGANYDYFGYSVEISGDYVVVGANYDDDNGSASGSAYIFEKPVTGWSDMNQTAKLKASDGINTDLFGSSVSISGDCVVIGAYSDNVEKGSAYVFQKPVSGWINMSETAKLTASDEVNNNRFGYSVCISGDFVFAGAYQNDISGTYSGASYFFEKPISGWVNANEDQQLLPDQYMQNSLDKFGLSVSVSGDYAVVGAMGYNSEQGCAYILFNNNNNWETIAILTASDGVTGDKFGTSVSISGDYIVIGAYGVYTSYYGAAYIFEKPLTGWIDMTETAKLIPSDNSLQNYFGHCVGIYGDFVVVGAWGDDENGFFSGAAYIYEKPVSGWTNMTQKAKLIASDGEFDCRLGYSAAISEDVVVLGSWGDEINGQYSGSAYIYEKPVNGWVNMTQTAKITATDVENSDYFGYSVDISGDNIVVGAYKYGSTIGAAYIFETPINGWTDMTQTAKLTASDGSLDYFAYSVSISGNYVVVGAYEDDDNGNNSGSAYIFEKPINGWTDMTESSKILASDGLDNDFFGCSVNISGKNIIVGAYGDGDNGSNSGSAYIFDNPLVNIETINQDGLSIIPNPTNGKIMIDFAKVSNFSKFNILISDITGRTVIEKIKVKHEKEILHSFDLSGFKSGIYIISIQTDKEIFTTKIVKE